MTIFVVCFSMAKFEIQLSDGYEEVCSSSSFQLRKNIWWCLKSIIIWRLPECPKFMPGY